MRLWTLHPRFLDAKGIVALWREGLLAKAVIEGKTRGYTKHPQLIRFYTHAQPFEAVCEYLHIVAIEAQDRGYRFDRTKLPARTKKIALIEESTGQLAYEWQHLQGKLRIRDPERLAQIGQLLPEPHPLFTIVPGEIKDWEKIA